MKKIYLLIICLSITMTSLAQNWLWSKQLGGNLLDNNSQICNDNSGNLYFSGSYKSDPCFFGNDTLHIVPGSLSGFFLIKLNSSGEKQWIAGYDGTSENDLPATITAITFDDINNYIYITGSFKGSGHIGNIPLISYHQDILIAKFDLNGNCLWAKNAGGLGVSSANSITIDGNRNVIITGRNKVAVSFDSIVVQPGYFLAKYSPNGNCIWAKKLFNENFSTYGTEALLRSLSAKGTDIYALGGSTVSSFAIDTITVNCNYSNGQYIIARFDSNGVAKWIKPCAGDFIGAGCDIKVDDSLNSYITGSFSQSGIFGNDTLSTTATAIYDLFLAKYSSAGYPVWIKQSNATSLGAGTGLALRGNDIYVTGGFADTITLGPNTTISYDPNGDMFAARYNINGNCIGIIHAGGMGSNGISVDGSNNIYITGSFFNTVTFGSNTPLSPYGQQDIYLAKSSDITGITDIRKLENNQLIIYANPTSGICNVTIPDEFQNEKQLTLLIYDNSGKLIQNIPVILNDDKVQINLQEEAKGIYNAILSNGKKSYSGKIVFE